MYDYDLELADKRLNAYIDMLKTSYDVDEYGLADMIGVHRGTWTKFRKADFENKGVGTIARLAELTYINLDWLSGASLILKGVSEDA